MKKCLFFILVAGIALLGCKKDSDSSPSNKGQFTINNATYNFSNMLWYGSAIGNSFYQIGSFDNVTEEMVISIPTPTVGDYNFNDPKNGGDDIYVDLTVGNSGYSSVHAMGKITITKFENNIIVGTFSGKFTNKTETVDASGSFMANMFSL